MAKKLKAMNQKNNLQCYDEVKAFRPNHKNKGDAIMKKDNIGSLSRLKWNYKCFDIIDKRKYYNNKSLILDA